MASGLVARREPNQPQAAGRRLAEVGHTLSLLHPRTPYFLESVIEPSWLSLGECEKGLWGWRMGMRSQPQLGG